MSDAQVATHFRCSAHDLVLPLAQYAAHVREEHAGVDDITITPVWEQA